MTAKEQEASYHEKTVEIRKESHESERQRLQLEFEKERDGYLSKIESLQAQISEL